MLDHRHKTISSETVRLGLHLDAEKVGSKRRLRRTAPGHLSKVLLLRVLAYRVQAARYGDLDVDTCRFLDRIASDQGVGRSTLPGRPARSA